MRAIDHPVVAVVLGQQHVHVLGCATWARSCRRSRRAAAARGGRGRRAPPAARRAAGRRRAARPAPSAPSGRSSSTSSTRTTSASSMPPSGIDVSSSGRGGLVHQVVAVERDVQRAVADLDAGEFLDVGGEPVGQCHTTGGDAEQHDARRVGTVQSGLFDDLMRDAGNGAADVGRGHQFPVGGERRPRHHARSDLLLRLSGRIVKGCRTAGQRSTSRRPSENDRLDVFCEIRCRFRPPPPR